MSIGEKQSGGERAETESLLDILAHSLRTPLMVIKNNGRIIEMVPPERLRREVVQPLARDIQASADRLNQALDGLLELFKIEMGELRCEPSAVLLGGVLRSEAVASAAGPERIVLDAGAREESLVVRAEPRLLERALAGVLAFAATGSEKDGKLRLSAKDGVGSIRLSIGGGGAETAADEARWILGGFSGERPLRTRSTAATLGLYVAKRSLELFGGRVSVEGAGPSSSLVVELPT